MNYQTQIGVMADSAIPEKIKNLYYEDNPLFIFIDGFNGVLQIN